MSKLCNQSEWEGRENVVIQHPIEEIVFLQWIRIQWSKSFAPTFANNWRGHMIQNSFQYNDGNVTMIFIVCVIAFTYTKITIHIWHQRLIQTNDRTIEQASIHTHTRDIIHFYTRRWLMERMEWCECVLRAHTERERHRLTHWVRRRISCATNAWIIAIAIATHKKRRRKIHSKFDKIFVYDMKLWMLIESFGILHCAKLRNNDNVAGVDFPPPGSSYAHTDSQHLLTLFLCR